MLFYSSSITLSLFFLNKFGNSIFQKKVSIDLNDADAWDDTLLIKAYDESLLLAKEEVAKKLARETNKPATDDAKAGKSPISYKKGDYCRATYSDGIDYEAKIENIIDDGKICLLKYVGYGNEEFVNIEDLTPSWGKKQRKEQIVAAQKDKRHRSCDLGTSESETEMPSTSKQKSNVKNKTTKRIYSQFDAQQEHMAFPPPPPMPPMLDDCDDAEHLSAMLMSWYMSGYYTGLYQGQKMSKYRHH